MADDKTSYSDLDIRFSVGETGFHALNIIYERLERNIPGHSHGPGCYEIHYIAAGHGRVILQGQAHSLSPGSLYVTDQGWNMPSSPTKMTLCANTVCIFESQGKTPGRPMTPPPWPSDSCKTTCGWGRTAKMFGFFLKIYLMNFDTGIQAI